MLNLDVLNEDPLAVYDTIVRSKAEPRRSRLGVLRDRIKCAYLRYYAHRSNLERLRPLGRRLDADGAGDLVHCYDGMSNNGSAAYDRYYAKILLLSYDCAYCRIHLATTLDHYLAKGGYPEFAVLPANLVPSCSRCNPPRDFRDAQGRRALIHPYFDVIRQERLLVADVRVEGGVPEAEFRVDTSSCSDVEFARLFERHVRLLKLLERYSVHACTSDEALASIVRTVRTWARAKDRAEILALLLDDAADFENRLGANHFKTALTRGVAASQAFLDFCVEKRS